MTQNTKVKKNLTIRIIAALAILLVIVFVVLNYSPNYHKDKVHRQHLTYPPDGAEKIALLAAALMIFWIILVNFLIINRLPVYAKIVSSLLIVLIFFGLIEVSLQRYAKQFNVMYHPHPLLIWERQKGFDTNSHGFRDKEFPTKKEDGEYRIIITGDSAAEGVGVEDVERFSDLLEKKLKEKYPGKKIRVINAAISGYSIVQVKYLADLKLYNFDPDLMIIAINNDPIFDYDEDVNRITPGKALPLMNLLYKSQLYLLLRKIKINRDFKRFDKKASTGEKTPSKVRVSNKDVRKYYGDVISKMKKRNKKVMILAMPVRSGEDVNAPPEAAVVRYSKYKALLGDIAKEQKIFFADLYSEWRAEDEKSHDRYFELDMVHPNVKGHEIIADRLFHIIVEEKIIP